MQDLDFRRKRRKGSSGRKAGKPRRSKRRASHRGLRFEDAKAPLHFAQEKMHRSRGSAKELGLWAVEILLVCLTAVFLVAAFGQRVSTAGDSMSPALRNGDVLLINRLVYKVKSPARGDIVAFRQEENGHYSVKRIVGLPGETVQISDSKVLIDGEELTEDIYVSDIEYAGEAQEPVELGEDEYFVMGDNHAASDDSRLPNIGNISRDAIYGKVWFIVSPGEDFGFISDKG